MSPPDRVGRHIVFPRASVRHKLCPLYNLKTVKDFSMKLGTLVNQLRRCVMHKNHNSSLSILGVISL